MVTGELLLMLALALAARFIVPKMMYSESVGVRFGIGCLLFVMYTIACVSAMHYFCCYSYNGGRGVLISDLAGSEVWNRVFVALLLTNCSVLFTACVFFFTRDKRTMTQQEKMKLKDL